MSAPQSVLSTIDDQNHPRAGTKPRRSDTTLVIIGAFKLVKGLLLVGVGIGALGLLHRDIADTFAPLMAHLHIDPEHRYLGRALTMQPFGTSA